MIGIAKTITENWNEIAIVDRGKRYYYSDLAKEVTTFLSMIDIYRISNAEAIAFKSVNNFKTTAGALACIISGTNFTIVPMDSKSEDVGIMIAAANSSIIFTDIKDRSALDFGNHIGHLWLDIETHTMLNYRKEQLDIEDVLGAKDECDKMIRSRMATGLNPNSFVSLMYDYKNKSINSECILRSPGIREGLKIMAYDVTEISKGIERTIREFYEHDQIVNSLVIGSQTPYVFATSTLYPLYMGGKVVFTPHRERPVLDAIKDEKINHVVINTATLKELVSLLVSDSPFLRRLKLWFTFKPYRKSLKKVILYGLVDNRYRKLFNALGIKFDYSYFLSECSAVMSYKRYRNLPKKRLTAGKPLGELSINSGNKNQSNPGEVYLSALGEGMARGIVYAEDQKLLKVANNKKGHIRTLDFGFLYRGELVVMGHADELLRNENGLTIQEGEIRAILLSYMFINDLVLVVDNSTQTPKLKVVIELNSTNLITKGYSLKMIKDKKIPKVLKDLNACLDNYTKVDSIVISPRKFVRKNGRIVTSQYNSFLLYD